MILTINQDLRLELITDDHALPVFKMVDSNRPFLRTWLSFVDRMETIDFATGFVRVTQEKNKLGMEYAFVIYEHNEPVGRMGVYKIDSQNRIGEIGYWLIENKQGKGIITLACKTLIDFCFDTLNLNRIELKCATANTKSRGIPERLSFKQEAVLHDAEWLHDRFVDLYLYVLLKKDRVLTTNQNPS
jgi:ribosomal-protein-serine acetyltransferase